MKRWLIFSIFLSTLTRQSAFAQQAIGTVGVQDAKVSGALEVTNGRVVLVGSTTVTATDHAAEVSLQRGGTIRICATSGLHMTAGKSSTGSLPLMLALDRGALEVTMPATNSDAVMTPDLRFSLRNPGPLDLHLRVTRNGDTCVDNRGTNAPTLTVSDQFGEATYELHGGQHVLFEHGNLKEVVDHESSPCGCPPEPIVSVADSGVPSPSPASADDVVAPQQAAEQHPFPAAVSQGLAPAPPVPQAPTGAIHAQVTTTLSYGADPAGPVDSSGAEGRTAPSTSGNAASTPQSPTAPAEIAQTPPPPAPPSGKDIAHRIGQFFKRLFGRG